MNSVRFESPKLGISVHFGLSLFVKGRQGGIVCAEVNKWQFCNAGPRACGLLLFCNQCTLYFSIFLYACIHAKGICG